MKLGRSIVNHIINHRPFHSIHITAGRAGVLTGRTRGESTIVLGIRNMASGAAIDKPISFQVTPYPPTSPERKPVRTAACVIIGDEILNGKTLDTNSNHFASLCFRSGINLKKIEVVPDEEDIIISSIRRLCEPENQIDMIITSGGIGPTHDDITYQSLAKVFDPKGELEYDQETIKRMEEYNNRRVTTVTKTEEQRLARHRMALFPRNHSQVLFVEPHLWVPVVCLQEKIFILPGVPGLFQQLLQALMCHYVPLPPESDKPHRVMIQTKLPESIIAPILTRFSDQIKVEKLDIKLGSYPNLITGIVNISLIGIDLDKLNFFSHLIQLEFDKLPSDFNLTSIDNDNKL
ncbi:hypothetical protein MJO28_002914 [Puccinia striiformis f. sp. tritici]|nr:hypothetical protein Pst134EA_005142 [Puccinia striiformis f. sp. tritici]KAH9471236.1 hypothetical protein Pst134EA_005142 [Puccinia striiformis f. sp. tritici]KAI7959123.1 hypothetical protein MJO28_002914 [Puccinia striiformis f. sp. tritici]KAI7964883.1 hypothetical protein MJO29_002981 [Puccinia striiformis f. sp. tritici]KAI9629445.1 hypothetical protein KEM48_012914 [Puccinia striiformis f. sp. tritici PST-130]